MLPCGLLVYTLPGGGKKKEKGRESMTVGFAAGSDAPKGSGSLVGGGGGRCGGAAVCFFFRPGRGGRKKKGEVR